MARREFRLRAERFQAVAELRRPFVVLLLDRLGHFLAEAVLLRERLGVGNRLVHPAQDRQRPLFFVLERLGGNIGQGLDGIDGLPVGIKADEPPIFGDVDAVVDLLPRQFVENVCRAAIRAGVGVVNTNYAASIAHLDQAALETQSSLLANVMIFGIIIAFMLGAVLRRVNLYEAFVEGAKDGFGVAVGIIPYLVAMLVAIGVFRASGALDLILDAVRDLVGGAGLDTRWVDGLPTALMKPLSGSGARGMMIETMKNFGADSFAGRLACVVQGSTETTFYVLAVYFGAVGIRKTRHAVVCGLAADAAGVAAAILVSYLFFG